MNSDWLNNSLINKMGRSESNWEGLTQKKWKVLLPKKGRTDWKKREGLTQKMGRTDLKNEKTWSDSKHGKSESKHESIIVTYYY